MAIICPAILEASIEDYRAYIQTLSIFAKRLQIDLTDGKFADSRTISPEEAQWPAGIDADLHFMYQDPMPALQSILVRKPHMIIVQAEADIDLNDVAKICNQNNINFGVCLLPETPATVIKSALAQINHVLIFAGRLGSYGGQADMSQIGKVQFLKNLKPGLEIGWDGGINDQNVARLVEAGVDVLNVGGFLKKSDNPQRTFKALQRIADETGTT